jgi:hypothetical protein
VGANDEYTKQSDFGQGKETGLVIHIYDETVGCGTTAGIRPEIEHPCGVTNVAWPVSFGRLRGREDQVTLPA